MQVLPMPSRSLSRLARDPVEPPPTCRAPKPDQRVGFAGRSPLGLQPAPKALPDRRRSPPRRACRAVWPASACWRRWKPRLASRRDLERRSRSGQQRRRIRSRFRLLPARQVRAARSTEQPLPGPAFRAASRWRPSCCLPLPVSQGTCSPRASETLSRSACPAAPGRPWFGRHPSWSSGACHCSSRHPSCSLPNSSC
jgi:hypothetical protein